MLPRSIFLAATIVLAGADPVAGKTRETYTDNSSIAEKLYLQAEACEVQGEPGKALEKYRTIVTKCSRTFWAGRAHARIGLLFEQNREFRNAFEAYEKAVNNYPNSGMFQKAIDGQVRVAMQLAELLAYAKAHPDRPKPARLPDEKTLTAMFKVILFHARTTEEAPEIAYQLGTTLLKIGETAAGREELWTMAELFSRHHRADDALFQVAMIDFGQSRLGKGERRQDRDRAKLSFELFLQSFPDSEKVPEARHRLDLLRMDDVRAVAGTARYYLSLGKNEAAALYYRSIREQYSDILDQVPGLAAEVANYAAAARLDD